MVLNGVQFPIDFVQERSSGPVVRHDVEVVPRHTNAEQLQPFREAIIEGAEVAPLRACDPESVEHLAAVFLWKDAGLDVFQMRRGERTLQFNDAVPLVDVAVWRTAGPQFRMGDEADTVRHEARHRFVDGEGDRLHVAAALHGIGSLVALPGQSCETFADEATAEIDSLLELARPALPDGGDGIGRGSRQHSDTNGVPFGGPLFHRVDAGLHAPAFAARCFMASHEARSFLAQYSRNSRLDLFHWPVRNASPLFAAELRPSIQSS